MNPEPSMLPERDERLGEILAAWIEAAERGEAPDRAEWLARHAEFATELEEFLANRARLQEVTESLCQAVRVTAVAPSRGDTPLAMSQENTGVLPIAEMIGRSVGEYDLLAVIGQGGMGLVYRARHRRLQRLVALKMLRANVLSDAGDVQRFRNEAEVLAQLDHPHIVPVHNVGEHEGRIYFSMKLIEGGGLNEQLGRFRDDLHRAARLVAQVARAVHHAHQRGILHRDLKPSNILLDREGQPHISDFGLAKRIETDASLTLTGAIIGTPQYMAPEQTSGRKGAVTTATDVYGLGAVLYMLLTGRPPFQGETVLETLEQVREREPDAPRRLNGKVDRDLETICLKCLQKEPQRRYESAQALAEDLEHCLAGKPIQARAEGRLERLWRWCRRNPVIAVLSVTVILLVFLSISGLATGSWLLWRERGETQTALTEARTNYTKAEFQRRRAEANFREAFWTIEHLLNAFNPNRSWEPVTVAELRQFQTEEALRFLSAFCEQSSDDPAVRLQQGAAYVHTAIVYQVVVERDKAQQAFRQAIAVFGRLVEDFPEDFQYLRELGWALYLLAADLYSAGRLQDANECYGQSIRVWREALRKYPEDVDSLIQLASFLCECFDANLCDPRGAVELARKAVALAPHLPKAWLTLGVASYRCGEWCAAEAALQEAVRIETGDYTKAKIACYQSMAQWQSGKRVEARVSYQQAIRLMERNFHARNPALRAEVAALLGMKVGPAPEKEKSIQKH